MNIETNIKDVIVSPPDSNGSKRSFGSDDSLEYSNDDRSVANGGKGKGAGEFDKPKDNILPPKYPPSSTATSKQPDTSMFTPQRKQSANMERLPGPLNLFSPGLSPIGHANHSQYEHEEVDYGVKNRLEDVAFATYDADMRDSMDSLEMTSPYFNKETREKTDEARPNYQFWRNKLFSNEHASDAAAGNESAVEKQSLLSAAPEALHHQRSFIRSNSNSFDSDFNLTPRHSLVYPTTDALYERSAALSPKSADVSMDSDLHVTKQSLVYPTTTALYERSTHQSANTSIDGDAFVARQSFVYPTVGFPSERGARGQRGTQSADVSIDSDAHVAHQSLIYPTTAALYDRTAQRSANASFDSELHVSKQSLVYPSSAALRYQRAGRPNADESLDSEISLVQQSDLRQLNVHTVGRGHVSLDLSKLSIIDREGAGEAESRSYDEDAMGQSLHSISLLPGSPASSSPAPKQRTSNFMFPPPRPNGISPSNLRSPAGESSADKRPSPQSSSNAPHQPRRTGLQTSSSDTEYAKSASKRRHAEHQAHQGAQLWKEAEDVAPSGVFSAAPTPMSALTSSMKSGWRTIETITGETNTPRDDRSDFGVDDDLSVSPPGPPSPSSVSAGSPSTRTAHHQHQHQHHHEQYHHQYPAPGAPSSSSLVVGGLYTLQVDSQGRPAFVPVLLDQHPTAAAGITFSSPNASEGLAATTHGKSAHGHHRMPVAAPAAAPQHQYSSPPPRRSNFDFQSHLGRTDEFDLTGPNSNHVDVEKVLDRALHRGSLSEEKVNKRWGGDTTKRNSPPVAMTHTGGLPPVTPQRGAHHTISGAGHSVPGSSAKSPFRLSVGADGKEHLQLSAGYYKERLLLRSLTSVLNTP